MQTQAPPNELACTLMEDELKQRRQYVRKVLKPYIKSVETEPLGLTINFSQGLEVSQIEEFIELERQCCAFLTFNIVATEAGTDLEISGPQGSEDVLQMFAHGAR